MKIFLLEVIQCCTFLNIEQYQQSCNLVRHELNYHIICMDINVCMVQQGDHAKYFDMTISDEFVVTSCFVVCMPTRPNLLLAQTAARRGVSA